jgi:hypothetical protein
MSLYVPERAEKNLAPAKIGALARVREGLGPMVCERWMPAAAAVSAVRAILLPLR